MNWEGPAKLRRRLVPLEELQPWPGNPRRGDVPLIVESLGRFGQLRSVLVQAGTGQIVAGNHVYHAAIECGWTHLAADAVDLTDDEAEEYLLIDNVTGQAGGWDWPSAEEFSERVLARAQEALEGAEPEHEALLASVDELHQRAKRNIAAAAAGPEEPPATVMELAHTCPRCGYEWKGSPR